jgi:hypothetical protein
MLIKDDEFYEVRAWLSIKYNPHTPKSLFERFYFDPKSFHSIPEIIQNAAISHNSMFFVRLLLLANK